MPPPLADDNTSDNFVAIIIQSFREQNEKTMSYIVWQKIKARFVKITRRFTQITRRFGRIIRRFDKLLICKTKSVWFVAFLLCCGRMCRRLKTAFLRELFLKIRHLQSAIGSIYRIFYCQVQIKEVILQAEMPVYQSRQM